MATSGSFNTSGYSDEGYPDHYTFSWTLSSQSIEGNYSVISWSLTGNGGANGYRYTTVKQKYVTVNGVTQSNETLQDTYNGTTPFSGTTTIYHNSDGTGSFSASAGGAFYYYGSYNSTGDEEWSLPTIPRVSSFGTISGNTIGSSMTVNINRNSSSFTHQLWYKLGSSGWYDLGTGIGTSKTFTVSNDLLSQLPSATSGTLQLCVRTYNGDKQIGDDVYKNVTVYVASSVGPTVGTITLNPHDINGHNILVQGKNKLTIGVSGCSAGTGSSIKSYTFSGPGISKTTTSTSYTSGGTISNTGSLTYTVTVTDNRGRTASKTKTITCYEYSQPYFTSFNAYRSKDAEGTSDPDGTYLHCTYGTKYSSVNGTNNISVKAYYVTGTTTKSVTGNNGIASVNLNESTKTYEVYLQITDSYSGVGSSSVITVFGASRILNITQDGTGVAIGKLADENELFDVRWKSHFRNDIVIDGKLIADGVFKVTEFYTGSTAGTIQKTLVNGDSLDSYKYLEIFYTDNNGNGHNSTKIYSPNGRTVYLDIIVPPGNSDQTTYIKTTKYTIVGDGNVFTITPSSTTGGGVHIEGSTIKETFTNSNYIKIIKVLGYK